MTMNILVFQMNVVELGLEVGSHSQLFYLPYFSRPMLSQDSWTKHCAKDNFQVSLLHGCAEKDLATRGDSGGPL